MIVLGKTFYIPLPALTRGECEELVDRLCMLFPDLARQRNHLVYAVSFYGGDGRMALRVSPKRGVSSDLWGTSWGTGETNFCKLSGRLKVSVSDVLSYNDC